jgi:hypothetical protein
MALLKCEKCEKTFWAVRDTHLCPICMVIEKGKQLAAEQQAAPRATFIREPATAVS